MARRRFVARVVQQILPFVVICAAISAVYGQGNQRPIEDFIDAQGQTSSFFEPIPDYLGWGDTEFTIFGSVDYAGLAAQKLEEKNVDLGTEVRGNMSERRLPDGRAEVTVNLQTKNALSWVSDTTHFADTPPVLPEDMILGTNQLELWEDPTLKPALGHCELHVKFINTAPGAPLPDLVKALIFGEAPEGFEIKKLTFSSTAFGEIRKGEGAGGKGRLSITQVTPTVNKAGLRFTVENLKGDAGRREEEASKEEASKEETGEEEIG